MSMLHLLFSMILVILVILVILEKLEPLEILGQIEKSLALPANILSQPG